MTSIQVRRIPLFDKEGWGEIFSWAPRAQATHVRHTAPPKNPPLPQRMLKEKTILGNEPRPWKW